MERAALLTPLFTFGLTVTALACAGGRPPRPQTANAPMPAKAAASAETAKPADPPATPACDFKVVSLSDPAQKQIRCGNGESFVVRRGEDGLWHEEMKVRAGTRPGYATPDEAGRARCCPPASE